MFSADFISGSRDFTHGLTSGVLSFIHLADACVLVMASVNCARVQLKTLSSPLKQTIEMFAVTNFSKSLYIKYISIKSLSSKAIRYWLREKWNACIQSPQVILGLSPSFSQLVVQ